VTFSVLEADPPWKFGDSLPGPKRGAASHYRYLALPELLRFPLPPLADDAVLFLWRVASMQQEALDVVKAWGFTVKTEIVWQKMTKTGKKHFGMGRIVRASHEVCLVAKRGRPVVMDRSVRSTFSAPVGRHSQKPDEFYGIVERLYNGPYARLFARAQRPGWTSFGNEIEEAAE
jgi:N6-adenosine-specific RNA methylase IME4